MNIGGWLQSWINVLTRPGEPAFEAERTKPHAQLSTALIWVSLAAVISGLISWLSARFMVRRVGNIASMTGLLENAGLPPEVLTQIQNVPGLVPTPGIMSLFWMIVGSILGFLIFVGLLHLTARILGGTGNFGMYAYLMAAFFVPLNLLSSVVGLVPLAGGCIAAIIWIYELVLAYFATRVEHKLSSGRAIVVVLIPLILLALVAACALAAMLTVLLPLISRAG